MGLAQSRLPLFAQRLHEGDDVTRFGVEQAGGQVLDLPRIDGQQRQTQVPPGGGVRSLLRRRQGFFQEWVE